MEITDSPITVGSTVVDASWSARYGVGTATIFRVIRIIDEQAGYVEATYMGDEGECSEYLWADELVVVKTEEK
ncbi:hypothetical protein [Mycobacterium phage PP]|uniref:Uncharacterized protein n=1 Tax=Mycobacterium phage PP TaxID=2077134 RepID=A0A2Z5XVC7_9CAUD|nr:hypothetical protein KIW36_gp08 [Mycobacterium phage PP]BBC53802.1 hypothetical protein [Mycobacterium phage PP]